MPKKVNKSLYEDKHPKTSTKGTGFKNKQKALDTLKHFLKKYIKKAMQNKLEFLQFFKLCNGMYNRAKYHPYQTTSMREAIKIFSKWLAKVKKK
jgi:hypothetical protein